MLHEEAARWQAKSWDELAVTEDTVAYERADGTQVEVTIVERTPEYLQILISVADGGWSSFVPITTSVLVEKNSHCA